VDSHVGLPIVNYDFNRLESFELVPFKHAIQSGADAVMIAHILLPKLDPSYPSSLSKIIVTDILRTRMHFNGVVITDDLTMGAIKENYGIGEAAKKAVEAGCDMVLVAHEYESESKVANALKKAVETGEITEARIDESVFRILKLKAKYNIENEQKGKVNIIELNNSAKSLLNKLD
jgi:beta-N-acetylhexosaminidase